jgi:hypothetical protein
MDLNESCEELLNRCPDPPVRGNVRTAQGILIQMQALDKRTAKITPLGTFSVLFKSHYHVISTIDFFKLQQILLLCCHFLNVFNA